MGEGALRSVGSGFRGEFVGEGQEGDRIGGRRWWTERGAAYGAGCPVLCSSIDGRR